MVRIVETESAIGSETFRKGLEKLVASVTKSEKLLIDMDLVANEVLTRAIQSPVPRDTADLERSASTSVDTKKREVIFGFNKVYAAFQDAPNKSGSIVIRPKKKKFLFIPLTKKARLHRIGNNPENEGLKRGVDYVLSKKAVIPIKPYGSEIGPNHYFSETLAKNVTFIFKSLAEKIRIRFEGEGRR